jgi:hypothetical protein
LTSVPGTPAPRRMPYPARVDAHRWFPRDAGSNRPGPWLPALLLALLLGGASGALAGPAAPSGPARACLTPFRAWVVDRHEQRYGMSCIPMSVELVLKLLDRVPGSYFDLQDEWREKADGTFGDFDGIAIAGVTFHRRFALRRGDDFPLDSLFATIHAELAAGRFAIVSLATGSGGYHMYVVYDEDASGDFVAVSKAGRATLHARGIRSAIGLMGGTDILTYEVARRSGDPRGGGRSDTH